MLLRQMKYFLSVADCKSFSEAAEQYNLNWYTVRTYMRQYRELNHLPNMSDGKPIKESNPADINELESMLLNRI